MRTKNPVFKKTNSVLEISLAETVTRDGKTYVVDAVTREMILVKDFGPCNVSRDIAKFLQLQGT